LENRAIQSIPGWPISLLFHQARSLSIRPSEEMAKTTVSEEIAEGTEWLSGFPGIRRPITKLMTDYSRQSYFFIAEEY
jgi:hypothetical protein